MGKNISLPIIGTPQQIGQQTRSIKKIGARQAALNVGTNLQKTTAYMGDTTSEDGGKVGAIVGGSIPLLLHGDRLGRKVGRLAGVATTAPAQSTAGLVDFGIRAPLGKARKADLVDQPLNALGVLDGAAALGKVHLGAKGTVASMGASGGLIYAQTKMPP